MNHGYTREFNDACIWVADLVERFVRNGKLDLPDTNFADYVFDLLESPRDGLTVVDGVPMASDFSEFIARELAAFAEDDYQFFDALMEYCGRRLVEGKSLPPAFSNFVGSVLLKNRNRPTKNHRPRKADWLTKYFVHWLTLESARRFGLTPTRTEEKASRTSASDAVADGLSICGAETHYSTVKNLLVHPDYARFRKEYEVAAKLAQQQDLSENTIRNVLHRDYFRSREQQAKSVALDIQSTFQADAKKR